MKTLDLTLSTPEENLACDEALLRLCERGGSGETLRFWEPDRHFVVLGLSNSHETETDAAACRKRDIPILRRCSGGGAVLQGPGCLNYALVLRIRKPGPLDNITRTNRFILQRHQAALQTLLGRPVSLQGDTDLTLNGLKFSGNSQRRSAGWLLFHGTFLLGMDLTLIGSLLPMPSRQPAYRRGRNHAEFLANLPVSATDLKRSLAKAWNTGGTASPPPAEELARLLEERYSRPDWNLRT